MAAALKAMGALFPEYKQALATFRRTVGQFRRYYNFDYESLLPSMPKRITEGSIRNIYRSLDEARRIYDQEISRRKEEERQQEFEEAKIIISNVVSLLLDAASRVSSKHAQLEIERMSRGLVNMIDMSTIKHGIRWVARRLKQWGSNYIDKLMKLATAIYSDHYNTNRKPGVRDKDGNVGRQRFRDDMEEFRRLLDVPYSTDIQQILDEMFDV